MISSHVKTVIPLGDSAVAVEMWWRKVVPGSPGEVLHTVSTWLRRRLLLKSPPGGGSHLDLLLLLRVNCNN